MKLRKSLEIITGRSNRISCNQIWSVVM